MKKLFFALTLLGFMATANATIVTTSTVATTISQDADDKLQLNPQLSLKN